jgi:peptidoglycan hydrolase FlgJ
MTNMSAISSLSSTRLPSAAVAEAGNTSLSDKAAAKEKFGEVLGEVMYGTMLKTVRQANHKPAYVYGGRGEEVFGQQLDQVLAEKIGKSTAGRLGGALGSLDQLSRR